MRTPYPPDAELLELDDEDRIDDPAFDDDLDDDDDLQPRRRTSRLRWAFRILGILLLLLIVAIFYLAITAPLSKSLRPIAAPSITLLAADGTAIARKGATIDRAVTIGELPEHVPNAFLAIEDRRFYAHWGIDPWGISRAMVRNVQAGGMREGGSTITQQLAKNAFLNSDRTMLRKGRELLIAAWLEAWLTKDEILARYLSSVYFGDNVYGLRAASNHYFSRDPEDLSIGQAAMLAGLLKAPSRLAPTNNLKGARDRQKLVVAAMARHGFLDPAAAADVSPARLKLRRQKRVPEGSYFADWIAPTARDATEAIYGDTRVTTTLDTRLQRAAECAVRQAGLRKAQVAIVAMRPTGQVVAMVGGKRYADSPFNRATQARRQPGSTFKLFVYLAALRAGMTPDSTVEDTPVTLGDWSPKNNDGRYRGEISLRRAFAASSNVVAARLTNEVGTKAVIRAARGLGVSTPIGAGDSSIALGTADMSLLELTAAYAAIASGRASVRPHGLAEKRPGWLTELVGQANGMGGRTRAMMLDLLEASVRDGTGRAAALPVETFGKTGTTQDNRDALFVGFAGDLVVGIWVGNDDNSPNPGLAGGGVPARIWKNFMMTALNLRAAPPPRPVAEEPVFEIEPSENGMSLETSIGDLELGLDFGPDGIAVRTGPEREREAPEDGPDERIAPRDREEQ